MKQSRPKKPDHQTGRNIFKKKKKLTVKENNLKKKKANKSGEGVHAGEGEIFDKAKPISSEILEKLLEEEDVKDTEIKNFLANPWKNVSLEKINSSPTLSLEQNLPKVEKTSEEEKDNINYSLFKNVEDGKYQPSTVSDEFKEKDLDEREKSFREQKRFYEKMKVLSPELKRDTHSGIEYVRPEDTIKKDYLTKKKFF